MIGKALPAAGWIFCLLTGAAGPPGEVSLPTRLSGASDPLSPMVRLEGFSFSWKDGLPPGVRGHLVSLRPPRSAVLSLLGLSRTLVLLRLGKAGPSGPGEIPPDFPDTLAVDLQGDGRFGEGERFPLRWERSGGLGRGRTGEIRIGSYPFEIQVLPRSGSWEGVLFPHFWRVGKGLVGRRHFFFLYVDQDLDGKVGPRDLWLLAGPGDPRRELRVLGPAEMRRGDAPFPLEGGKAVFLERIGEKGRAFLKIVKDGSLLEARFLARRAARVRERWARRFAVDDEARRKLLGLRADTPLGHVSIPWIHTTDPLPLWVRARPGKPVLFWVDSEGSTECRRLEHYALGADEVARRIVRGFVPVHVPLGLCAKDPRKRWGVISLPALVVVGSSGKVLWRHEGFLPPGKLAAALKAVLEKEKRP